MIFINDISSFRDPEKAETNFEHRIEKIELIDDTVAQNHGHIPGGDVISLECVFSKANFNALKALWEAGTRVTYTDETGAVFENLLLVLDRCKNDENFKDYVHLTFELWRAKTVAEFNGGNGGG